MSAVLELPQQVLRAAVCGVLICKGWKEEKAKRVLDHDYDLMKDEVVSATVREIASVTLTLREWGWISNII